MMTFNDEAISMLLLVWYIDIVWKTYWYYYWLIIGIENDDIIKYW